MVIWGMVYYSYTHMKTISQIQPLHDQRRLLGLPFALALALSFR